MTPKPPRTIELVEFALLSCQFHAIGPVREAAEAEPEDTDVDDEDISQPVPGFEFGGARLNVLSNQVDEQENEFVFVLETTLAAGLPFELSVVTGSRFTVPDPPVSPDDAAVTLLFITFPYLRELIFSVTSRSPFEGFQLPPLTKRPVWGDAGDDGDEE